LQILPIDLDSTIGLLPKDSLIPPGTFLITSFCGLNTVTTFKTLHIGIHNMGSICKIKKYMAQLFTTHSNPYLKSESTFEFATIFNPLVMGSNPAWVKIKKTHLKYGSARIRIHNLDGELAGNSNVYFFHKYV